MTEKPAKPESTPVPVAETTEEISDIISKLETNKITVLVAIVAGALILSAVILFRGLSEQKSLAAAEAYSQAVTTSKIEDLDQVIADYPQSTAAGNALLTKAELQLTSGKSEDARSTLLAFTEKYKKHPRHTQGLFATANLYQLGGDSDNAAKFYDRVLKENPKSDIAPLAMIRQGDLLLAAGKNDEARQKYEAVMPTYRGTPFYEQVEEKIELLAVEKLPVVDAPKKPAPKPIAKKPTPKSKAKPAAKKPASKAPAKTSAKPAAKTPVKPAGKAAAKTPAKPAVKAPAKPAAKPAIKTPAKPADKKTVQSPPAPEKKEAGKPVPADKKEAPADPKN